MAGPDVASRPRLLAPNGEPFPVRDLRAVAKAGQQLAGPTPTAITAGMAAEGMGATSFLGPGAPVQPTRGYSQRPRSFDYPAGINITSRARAGYGKASFATLKAIIDAYDIARICINHKIDSLRSMELQFVPSDLNVSDADGAIAAARAALAKPDRELDFDGWLAKWMEGMLRYDAATLYRRRNKAGQVMALEVVDGTTIVPHIDEHGRKPLPPAPAYTQIIKGSPWDWLTTDDVIYSPFRPQTDSPYGLAPIEAVLLTANTDLRFQWHFLQYFTDGSMPAGFMEAPPDATTPDQVMEWQDYWDAMMLGDQAMLQQIKMVPAGSKFTAGRNPTFDENFPLSLIRRTCAAFGVVPNDLGLTMDVNLANGETQVDVQYRVNDRPVQLFVQGVLTAYLQRDLGLPVKVEFDDGQEKEDRLAEAQTWQIYIDSGMASADEAREKLLGLPTDNERPLPRFYAGGKQGPIPLVDIFAASGPISPDTAAPADDVPIPDVQFPGGIAGVVPEKFPGGTDFTRAPLDPVSGIPVQGSDVIVPPSPVVKEATGGVTVETGIVGHELIGSDDEDDEPAEVMKAAEITAFTRFVKARRRAGRWRDFTFATAEPAVAHRLNVLGRAEVRKAAGELIAAGLAVVAQDTGRVLMIQRAFDLDDPASGKLEFPGGHIDADEDPMAAAAREWFEEVGLMVPFGGTVTTGWTSANGIYEGFVYSIVSESLVDLDARNCSLNPDGDLFEACLWVDPADLPGNPLVRDELGADLDVVLAAICPSDDVVKAADARPKDGNPRWHDAPIRRLDAKVAEHHAAAVSAALVGLLSPGKITALVEGYQRSVS